ncbi:uncharacterized protein C6orf47 homolog [Corythoichthys intestinalis]|uniref:uncharacterized protein C6orf47 homolog n=1 Tax=Corythoichthys intestinalis TaxID=161448 RepID=UPI0025A5BE56|nr:uncharacterized protein C6orf47 homolog [Corythoichthys intestinalis]XP_061808608.1 uncharacterized protein C6orf47-like [Nerophis lumbriciformis]
MASVVGRAWGWLRSWRSNGLPDPTKVEDQKLNGSSGSTGDTRGLGRQNTPGEDEYWEAQEKLQPLEIEDLGAGKQESETAVERLPRWWNKYLPTSFLPWSRKAQPTGAKHPKHHGKSGDGEFDGDFSDYGTPPPSPTPGSQLPSPFRLFVHSWNVELFPEHYEICFNFLRHLFDLFVVGFLWIVSPPVKLILEILGIQGPLRLWLHGMAMFFVSTVGMAGLLWLIQEHLPEFAFIYGIVQALVISVSLKKSVLLGLDDENSQVEEEENREVEVTDEDGKEMFCASGKMKTS